MLADQPRAGRPFGSRRKYPCPPYLIVYRPIRGGVEVTRVVDGRRDLKKILK